MENSKDSTDLLLVGKTGNGKSALGNAILQRKSFMSKNSTDSVTKETDFDFSEFEGRTIQVVDGPGLGDTDLDPQKAAELVVNSMSYAICTNTKGFHAILLVVRYGGRFTKEDTETVATLKKIFGEKFITDHAILVMTCGDSFYTDAEDTGQTFEEWCADQKGVFEQLYKEVKERVILFNNKTKNGSIISDQLRQLLAVVDKMGARYTTEIFEEAKETRNSLLQVKKRPTLSEDAVKEAALITQLLGRLDYKNSEKGLQQLQNLMERADVLHDDILKQDQGTNQLSAAKKMAQNLMATVTEHLHEMKRGFETMHQERSEQRGRQEPEYEDSLKEDQGQAEKEESEQSGRPGAESEEREAELKSKSVMMNEKMLSEKRRTFTKKQGQAIQDLNTHMEHWMAEREEALQEEVKKLERNYQDAKGESRSAWMVAQPSILSKIMSGFDTLRRSFRK